jgi:hypothetical protein
MIPDSCSLNIGQRVRTRWGQSLETEPVPDPDESRLHPTGEAEPILDRDQILEELRRAREEIAELRSRARAS